MDLLTYWLNPFLLCFFPSQGILSKAMVCPGSNTLIMNLISSCNVDESDEEGAVDNTTNTNTNKKSSSKKRRKQTPAWLRLVAALLNPFFEPVK